jgi:hypothetical protein
VPRATVNLSETRRLELKSLPEGFVELRRMSYGQKLARQEQAVKTSVEQKKGQTNSKMNLDMLQHASTVFDFRACIVDHNLEDEKGQKLNLTQVSAIDSLDPRVGEEIATEINDMNNFEPDLEESGFQNGSAPQ